MFTYVLSGSCKTVLQLLSLFFLPPGTCTESFLGSLLKSGHQSGVHFSFWLLALLIRRESAFCFCSVCSESSKEPGDLAGAGLYQITLHDTVSLDDSRKDPGRAVLSLLAVSEDFSASELHLFIQGVQKRGALLC